MNENKTNFLSGIPLGMHLSVEQEIPKHNACRRYATLFTTLWLHTYSMQMSCVWQFSTDRYSPWAGQAYGKKKLKVKS